MKIGIVTIIDNTNYGNRLQNYALCRFLEQKAEANVVTINNERFFDYKYVKKIDKKRIEDTIKKTYIIKKIVSHVRRKRDSKNYKSCLLKKREERFIGFNKRYIEISDYVLTEKKNSYKKLLDFDYFVVGSDQVWNPNFERATKNEFLQFTSKEKRLAYAASFGIENYPEERQKQLKIYLDGMQEISVREKSGKVLVEKYSNKSAEIVVDPTLLLTAAEWEMFEREPSNNIKSNYLVTYFLGTMTKEQEKVINEFAKKNDLQIISLNSEKAAEWFDITPEEFVFMIHHSEAVFTDSFHGCIFSLIFNKQFWVFKRDEYNIYSRIENILSRYNLYKLALNNPKLQELKYVTKADYKNINICIERERIQSSNWLLSALHLEE